MKTIFIYCSLKIKSDMAEIRKQISNTNYNLSIFVFYVYNLNFFKFIKYINQLGT